MRKIVFTLLAFFVARGSLSLAQAPAPVPVAKLHVGGAVGTPLTLTLEDLTKLPRKTLAVVNPHSQKKENYEGVALEEILRKAGVPSGERLRGAAMATYVVAEATDGYRVVFSLAEIDSGILDNDIIVADTMDSVPLSEKEGPFKIIAPHEKRPARWVRMLKSIAVVSAQ